ncbi:MAG: phosphoadenosine phosphosulfate reductase [Paracoccaceae bacterium]
MQDAENTFNQPLAGLSQSEWLHTLEQISIKHGDFHHLGPHHYASHIRGEETLIVTFETMQGIRALDEDAQPMGWDMVKSFGWSNLVLISDGDTWFRDEAIFAYMDYLVDKGFFDEFDNVVFYGAGPCGYAAAAFSVVAPGARVVAIQPQATLDPSVASWDERFTEERRRDFTSRYGYAPDMLDAAKEAFVIYDPTVALDAMHAALFTRDNVIKLPVRHMGATIQTHFMEMRIMFRILVQVGTGKLSRKSFAKLMRARRDYPPYLRNLLSRLEAEDRSALVEQLCHNVTSRMKAPKFSRRLKELRSG